MAKLTVNDVTNLQNESTAVAAINTGFAAVETAMEKTLSRDGTSPNSMAADLDMNSNSILNLPAAIEDTEPVRKAELDDVVDDLETTVSSAISQINAAIAGLQATIDAAVAAAIAGIDFVTDAELAAAIAGVEGGGGVTPEELEAAVEEAIETAIEDFHILTSE